MEYNGMLMSADQAAARIQGGEVSPLDIKRMPLYLQRGGDFEMWLTSRAVDRHRANSRILKKVLRLHDASDAAAVLRAHGSTITDNYWFLSDGEELSWSRVRFTEDTFSEVALTGSFASYSKRYAEHQLRAGSPELTNIGSFEKCWRIEDGQWWMMKTGTAEERFSEIFIARLGEALGFSMAEYQPDGPYVKTLNFTGGIYNYEPAWSLVGENEDYSLNYNRLTDLYPPLGRQYLDILYMDALCFNMDRHTLNYGILRDGTTGEVVSMAPNFDNNIALISRGYPEDPNHTNGLLIAMFAELLREKGIAYKPPALSLDLLRELAGSTLPDESVDRENVVQMVMERGQRLEQAIDLTGEMEQTGAGIEMV